jgi:hypothetical protein
MKTLLATILFLLVTPFSVFASQIPASAFPDFTQDGTVYGADQDGYYFLHGGTAFTPETTFTAGGVVIRGCSATSSPVQVFFDVYDESTFGGNPDTFTPSHLITTWAGSFESCSGGIQDIMLNHNWDYTPTTITFEAGKKYILVQVDGEGLYSGTLSSLQYEGTTIAEQVQLCWAVFSCGGNFRIYSGSTAIYLSFNTTGAIVETPVTCTQATLPYFNIQNCLSLAFLPTQADLDAFHNLSLASTTPFGYIYDIRDLYTNFASSTATTSVMQVSLAPFNLLGSHVFASTSIMLLSASSIQGTIGAGWWTFIQTALGGGEWLLFLAWVYKRIQTIV